MKVFLCLVVVLATAAAKTAKECEDAFTKVAGSLTLNQVCNKLNELDLCLSKLSINERDTEETQSVYAVLAANQIKFDCGTKGSDVRRDTQIITDEGNVEFLLSSDKDVYVSRVSRESTSILSMDKDVKECSSKADDNNNKLTDLTKLTDQHQIDINQLRETLKSATESSIKVAVLNEKVSNIGKLSDDVDKLATDLDKAKLDFATKTKANKDDIDALKKEVEGDITNQIKQLQAELAAAKKTAGDAKTAATGKITAASMPSGSVVQFVQRLNENAAGSYCGAGADTRCLSIPHYGNNLGNYRRTPIFVEITTKLDKSKLMVFGNIYIYTIGGSHFYVDLKRSQQGKADVSMTEAHRKTTIADEITGGHPNIGMGVHVNPMILDSPSVPKGTKLRYTVWVASWSSGRMVVGSYPNNNERALNMMYIQEIAP
eukprot:m.206681 g.206681  ORF g.206681 m.206681 type:complete len:431 (+) comp15798_c0_seq2:100-1392(+)